MEADPDLVIIGSVRAAWGMQGCRRIKNPVGLGCLDHKNCLVSVFFPDIAHIFCHCLLCLSETPPALPWEVLLLSVTLRAVLPPGPACPPLCYQRNPQPWQSNDLQFVLIYLEFSLELCWATGSVIPHVFYVSQGGFWVLCWRIKALFGGTCSLTIQLDKLSFPCNLNKLCQNINCARIQSYLLTP